MRRLLQKHTNLHPARQSTKLIGCPFRTCNHRGMKLLLRQHVPRHEKIPRRQFPEMPMELVLMAYLPAVTSTSGQHPTSNHPIKSQPTLNRYNRL